MSDNWIIDKSDLILITGANGFIGLKVYEALLEYGFTRLRCLVRSKQKSLGNEAACRYRQCRCGVF